MSSRFPVLPGEETEAYRVRLMAWTGELQPRNQVELYLVERAVNLSWQLDRADRAESVRLLDATRIVPDEGSRDGTTRSDRAAFDDSNRGERLRRHQWACGRLLLRTLDLLAGLHRTGATDGRDPVASSSPLGDDSHGPAAAMDRGAPADAPEPIDRAAAQTAGSSIGREATILDALAMSTPIEMPPAVSTRRRYDAPAATRGPRDDPGQAAHPSDAPRRARPLPRLISRRLASQPDWPVSHRPGTTDSTSDGYSSPDRRDAQAPEASPNRPAARRRVGGYAVPLDPAMPVSCADRIPVRLRRQANEARKV